MGTDTWRSLQRRRVRAKGKAADVGQRVRDAEPSKSLEASGALGGLLSSLQTDAYRHRTPVPARRALVFVALPPDCTGLCSADQTVTGGEVGEQSNEAEQKDKNNDKKGAFTYIVSHRK